jgi:hypothetical protein
MGQLLAAGNRTLVLETIIWIGFVVTAVETKTDKSVSGGSSSLRSVRNAAYAQLSAFFTTYPDYELSATAEKAIFSVFVWRPLAHFDSEFIHSPTGLLSLVLTWSKEPRHLKYLSATCLDTGLRVLQNICKVLARPAAAPKVKSAVLELVKNLVTPPGEEGPPEAGPSLGVSIVLPELDVLLAHFSDWLRTVGNKGDNKKEAKKGLLKGGLDTRLEILMHLAPHIARADWAAECLHQLLQLLPALKQRPEAVAKVLVIAQNLVAQAGDDSCCRQGWRKPGF